MTQPRVVVIVRDGCHLCVDAVAVAQRVCAETGADFATLDVDADPALAEHTDHVPVTFVDGRRLAIWFLDEEQLRAALG
ncbi:MAG: glutaredoxin family protein [Micropruina sp.]|uniref:glutaredoxin family protein n=1 Tax=Micropruina sp. TaxID=2737536 RepID=UPI0039E485F0